MKIGTSTLAKGLSGLIDKVDMMGLQMKVIETWKVGNLAAVSKMISNTVALEVKKNVFRKFSSSLQAPGDALEDGLTRLKQLESQVAVLEQGQPEAMETNSLAVTSNPDPFSLGSLWGSATCCTFSFHKLICQIRGWNQ